MTRLRIDLSYKGTNYHGWQIQENACTVQEELNRALSVVLREDTTTTGCGRTDTGVHARRYTAHFDSAARIDDLQNLRYKLNMILSKDIAVNSVSKTYGGFHARFDVVKRTYKYFIHTAKNPFLDELSTFMPNPPDIEKMNAIAALLPGKQDFTSFSKLHTDVSNNLCTVFDAFWTQDDDKYIFTISANRFLRNMVRALVGTMLDAGKDKTVDFAEIIRAKDRCAAGMSAPPQGLFLWDNSYTIDN
jgi:tRNA pseudouridine38-40 synthase